MRKIVPLLNQTNVQFKFSFPLHLDDSVYTYTEMTLPLPSTPTAKGGHKLGSAEETGKQKRFLAASKAILLL